MHYPTPEFYPVEFVCNIQELDIISKRKREKERHRHIECKQEVQQHVLEDKAPCPQLVVGVKQEHQETVPAKLVE